MRTFKEIVSELESFDKTFNSDDFESCVKRCMLLLEKTEAQVVEDGYEFHIDLESCRWAIEQAITNRADGVKMMAAAIEYVESVEERVWKHNGLS